MFLTFEYDREGALEVTCDQDGRNYLITLLGRIASGDHEHLSTPAWGGDQLSEEFPNPDLAPIHQVTIQVR
jgi:hypothetical protein